MGYLAPLKLFLHILKSKVFSCVLILFILRIIYTLKDALMWEKSLIWVNVAWREVYVGTVVPWVNAVYTRALQEQLRFFYHPQIDTPVGLP